jgi:hypothetical protein
MKVLDGDEGPTPSHGRFTSCNELRYTVNRRVAESQSQSGQLGKEKNLFLLLWSETQTVQSTAESLYRLHYLGSGFR